MNNAVLARLLEDFRQMSLVTAPTPKEFARDTYQTGEGREFKLCDFLRSYVSKDYNVRKGLIYDAQGGVSQEIDSVVIAPNHPAFDFFGRKVILAEGVHAAIELKPIITSVAEGSEFKRLLDQIESVKQLERRIQDPNFVAVFDEAMADDLNELNAWDPNPIFQIPCFVFSYQSATPTTLINSMKSAIIERNMTYDELPDCFVTLDRGVLIKDSVLTVHQLEELAVNDAQSAYIHLETSQANTLALFIYILLNVKPPEPAMFINILEYYLNGLLSYLRQEGIQVTVHALLD